VVLKSPKKKTKREKYREEMMESEKRKRKRVIKNPWQDREVLSIKEKEVEEDCTNPFTFSKLKQAYRIATTKRNACHWHDYENAVVRFVCKKLPTYVQDFVLDFAFDEREERPTLK
jgi:hypothetical protein